ncbi:hypothetical protein CSC3H3_01885 [Thalassospira marina]|uniref:Uncharacterized protein n=1 Tax=Thalassospira marina TaxID=2048283 RepID=A0ABM6Q678_9PROT|nr:hypothetical protein CSC3H3_01885 [Thalassospira marina]
MSKNMDTLGRWQQQFSLGLYLDLYLGLYQAGRMLVIYGQKGGKRGAALCVGKNKPRHHMEWRGSHRGEFDAPILLGVF